MSARKPFVAAISGIKNSGKTTFLEHLVPVLRARGLRVAVIKHDGHDFTPDVPGTDSFRMRQAGADGVAVYSGHQWMVVRPSPAVWKFSSACLRTVTSFCWRDRKRRPTPRSSWYGAR